MPGRQTVVLTPAELAAVRKLVTRSRAAQGLPPTIEDPVVLDRIAYLFATFARYPAKDGAGDQGP